MATRENQGLQIALIIFLMITVGLAISTYYFFRQADEANKERLAAKQEAAQTEAKYKSTHYQLQSLKQMVGVPNITDAGLLALKPAVEDDGMKEIARIRADFDADMALFDETVAPENRNWRLLGRTLLATIMKRSSDLEASKASEQKTSADKDAAVAAEVTKNTTTMTALAAQKEDVAAVRETFNTGVEEANKAKGELEARLAQSAKELADQTAALNKKLLDAEGKLKDERADSRGKAARIKELTSESFERPHGQITWVNQRNGTCYINLGRADSLRRQVTFSVYDPSVATLDVPVVGDERAEAEKDKPKRKASIEVIEILDDHLAECRILDDNLKDLILPGDYIFTPAWRPGQKLQFALVGRMNIDGDKEDDRQKVKNLIEANGGEIVSEVLDNGKRVGNITVNTRFLVIGERPEDAADDTQRAAFNEIIGAAERNGVQQITVRDLVTMMGYKGTDRTVTVGRTGAADIEEKKPANGFRPRPKPAAAGDNGAF